MADILPVDTTFPKFKVVKLLVDKDIIPDEVFT